MSEIKEALTAEEWAKEVPIARHTQTIVNGKLYHAEVFVDDKDRHGLAALCLHGQPFGFTWEDVEWVRTAADRLLKVDGAYQGHRAEALDSIADRIAALLPQEDVA